MSRSWFPVVALFAVLAAACSSPEEGAERGGGGADAGGALPPGPDGGAPRKTCGDVLCDPNATCAGAAGEARCACLEGYEGDGATCTDRDECAEASANDCAPGATCVNRPGGFLCECAPGSLGDGRTCEVVDRCAGDQNPCDPNAVCVQASPGFACECTAGFRPEGGGCADVDECAASGAAVCAANAHCENRFGGYDCACDAGFTGDGDVACRSLCDEARADATRCAADALCRVLGDEASCDACAPGSSGDGKSCAPATCPEACDGLGDDPAHQICTAAGACACAPGYAGSPCADVDECEGDPCGAGATCQNVPGGYLCACPAGTRAEAGGCVDVDECATKPGPCHPDATCTNQPGGAGKAGYLCACREGFRGDGAVCVDDDECAAAGACPADSLCTNVRGGHECSCPPPLVGEPGSCHCDLGGLWAMRQDLDTCWAGRPLLEGTEQDLVSAGDMEANVWELYELRYDGAELRIRRKGCGTDNTPDLVSPLFRETYSSYVPLSVFDPLDLAGDERVAAPGLVPGAEFTTPAAAAVVGLELGGDPLSTPWPASSTDVTTWTDPDEDGTPGLTVWPRVPSELTDSGTRPYDYLPVRPALGGTTLTVAERAGCVSVAARVVTHLEAALDSCTRLTGRVVNERTEGRVAACTLVDRGTCNPSDPTDCSGWKQDVTCTAEDWKNGVPCSAEDLTRLDDDQNQVQDSRARFELVRIGALGDARTCADVRTALPAVDHSIPTISCVTPQ